LLGVRPHNFRNVIVQNPAELQCVARFRPVAKHHRHGREHLHRNAGCFHRLDPALGIPNVIGDLAKNFITDHHPRAAFVAVLEPDKSRVTKFLIQVRPRARQNVRVNIDLHGRKVTGDM
jgi:hypothetical protein